MNPVRSVDAPADVGANVVADAVAAVDANANANANADADATATGAQAAAEAAQAAQPGSSSDARIAHLFRGARRQGLIHPLQHLLQRHRAAGGDAP